MEIVPYVIENWQWWDTFLLCQAGRPVAARAIVNRRPEDGTVAREMIELNPQERFFFFLIASVYQPALATIIKADRFNWTFLVNSDNRCQADLSPLGDFTVNSQIGASEVVDHYRTLITTIRSGRS